MYKVLITTAGASLMKGDKGGLMAAMCCHTTVVEFPNREDAERAAKKVNEANPKGIGEVNNEFVQSALCLF